LHFGDDCRFIEDGRDVGDVLNELLAPLLTVDDKDYDGV
jgi:hypothetical protein